MRSRSHPHTYLQALGQRLQMLRQRRGLGLKTLADAAHISARYLRLLESGSGNPSLRVLLRLAAALNCDAVELIGDVTCSSTEWRLLRQLLMDRSARELALACGVAMREIARGEFNWED